MRNHLEHEFYEKYYDFKDTANSDFQWVIDHIEETFDFMSDDITDYASFIGKHGEYVNVFNLLVDINKIKHKKIIINNDFLNELNNLSLYYLNQIELPKIKDINSLYKNFLLFFYIGIYIAKQSRDKNFIYDFCLLVIINFFQISDYSLTSKDIGIITDMINSFNFEEKTIILNIFNNNVKKVEQVYDNKILELTKLEELRYKLFNASRIVCDLKFVTWQERYLLDIIGIRIDKYTKQRLYRYCPY